MPITKLTLYYVLNTSTFTTPYIKAKLADFFSGKGGKNPGKIYCTKELSLPS